MNNTYYFKTGNIVNVEPSDALEVLDHLPATTYIVKQNVQTNRLYLQTTENFSLPAKVYGNPISRVERIKRTFDDRNRSTGILLAGDKGSGKTLLSKALSISLLQEGIPTIVVNEPWCGQEFNNLIGNIKQPAVVIFDEFDKVYNKDEQQELLTLLDGTVETKKLFVLTTNSGYIDEHLLNRPGRIYYKFQYAGIDETFVREYLNDTLNNKSYIDEFVRVSNSFSSFTFDMCQTLVEEMNRYGESPTNAIQDLNIDLTTENVEYKVSVLYDGMEVNNVFYPKTLHANPLFEHKVHEVDLYFDDNRTLKNSAEKNFPKLYLDKQHFVGVHAGGTLVYEFEHKIKTVAKKVTVVVERQQILRYNWNAV
jgi:hypothetical protein